MPILGPHARFERIRTPNARWVTPGHCFDAFHGENHKKFVLSRKIMKTSMHDALGDVGVWKKFGGPPAESEKKTQYGADLLHIRSVSVA